MQVGIVTVGDELLTGDTLNTNATWLGRELASRGVTVARVTVVPDQPSEIADVVEQFRYEYDAVIVTGGLGPTHDDVTMAGIAMAFDREIEENSEALSWLVEQGGYSHDNLTEETAYLPVGAEPIHNVAGVAPGAILENVYVLPGVPAEMKAMFETIEGRFSGERSHVIMLHTNEPESALVTRFERVQNRFDVAVGSYPGNGVRIKLSGTDSDAVIAAAEWLRDRIEHREDIE